jgi:1,4-dihydroxy-2-naphthoate octaprenyltransferase
MLVMLFISYYLSTVSFYHTHYFSWGTVTHSHPLFPFGDNPANHSHTQNQCQTIQYLSNIILTNGIIAVIFFIAILIRRINIPVRCYQSHIHLISSPLRAPPVLICL